MRSEVKPKGKIRLEIRKSAEKYWLSDMQKCLW